MIMGPVQMDLGNSNYPPPQVRQELQARHWAASTDRAFFGLWMCSPHDTDSGCHLFAFEEDTP